MPLFKSERRETVQRIYGGSFMLVSDVVELKWNPRIKNEYTQLGYIYTKMKDSFKVRVSDLKRYSMAIVKIKCDYCPNEIERPFSRYMTDKETRVVDKDCCKECASKKVKEQNLINYGVENTTQLDTVKKKMKSTMLERYGVDNPLKHDEFKQKSVNTNLLKRGVPYPTQDPTVQEKIRNSYFENGSISTSKPQLKVYEMLKNELGEYKVELNFPFSRTNLDIAIFFDDCKIAVEYDGRYWHDETSDRRKDEFLKSNEWKILRIKSRRKVPEIEVINKKISELRKTEKSFNQIVLDDWNHSLSS